MLLFIAFFSKEFIFNIKYASLQNISLLLGFAHHHIDFGYCNSAIFMVASCENKAGI